MGGDNEASSSEMRAADRRQRARQRRSRRKKREAEPKTTKKRKRKKRRDGFADPAAEWADGDEPAPQDLNPYAPPRKEASGKRRKRRKRRRRVGASKARRFVNFIVDTAVITFVQWVLLVAALLYGDLSPDEQMRMTFAVLPVGTLYYTVMELLLGRTIGKFLTGTEVITLDEAPLTFGKALLRSVVRLIPFEAFSVLASPSASGWHDQWPGTRVVMIEDRLR